MVKDFILYLFFKGRLFVTGFLIKHAQVPPDGHNKEPFKALNLVFTKVIGCPNKN